MRTLLVFSQTFVPDPAAVGQYMFEASAEMARRGYRVIAYTADRGYDDATIRYPRREFLDGVDIRRVRFASLGKRHLALRVLALLSFLGRCLLAGLFTRRIDGLLVSTSPPLIGTIAAFVSRVRGVPLAFWAMDLNPDQLIALGKLREDSHAARILGWLSRVVLRRASYVIALDRFMAERLRARGDFRGRLDVIPPWPHERFIQPVARDQNGFRRLHGLEGKKVVMYSGNHTHSNPLATFLAASLQYRNSDKMHFAFVGGGLGKADVETWIQENQVRNVLVLPYQPSETLAELISAADVHVVSLGDAMTGVIHPSKVYAAMAAARPVLYFGPTPSHITDLLDKHSMGWRIRHGDVAAAEAALRTICDASYEELDGLGSAARTALADDLSEAVLLHRLADGLEQTFNVSG